MAAFVGVRLGFLQSYRFKLRIRSLVKLDASGFLYKRAYLVIHNSNADYYHGVIAAVIDEGSDCSQQYRYTIVMNSPLVLLQLKVHSRVFVKRHLCDVISELLKGKVNCKFVFLNNYSKRDLIIQLHETDYDFILRNLFKYGWYFKFKQSTIDSKIIVTDDINGFKVGKHNLCFSQCFDDDFSVEINSRGEFCRLATVKTDIEVGDLIAIKGCLVKKYNRVYRVVGKCVFGNQAAGFASDNRVVAKVLYAKLTLISATDSYKVVQKKPRAYFATQTATIESMSRELAYLDDCGRYHLRFDFDENKHAVAAASNAINSVQHLVGNNCGMHFPLYHGAKVVVSWLNGDVDRPVILGVLPNNKFPSVVGPKNVSQNILSSNLGSGLLLDDKIANEKLEVFNRSRNLLISLNAKRDKHKVLLSAKYGELNFVSYNNQVYRTAGDILQIAKGQHAMIVACYYNILANKGTIDIESAQDINFYADGRITTKSLQGSISYDSGNDIKMLAQQQANFDNRSGQLSLHGENIFLQANRGLTLAAGGAIVLQQAGAVFKIDRSGAISLQAKRINFLGKLTKFNDLTVRLM